MFYAHIILAKKGPLARVWLAAHWDKKITKAHVFETNIEKSVEGIMQPKVKLALRTSGHLLLGVVRIYSRKAKYLLADCNEAFVKIKMAFRPGMVDLPEGHREANVNAITLPEVFHDFDTALPELNDIDIEAQFSVNQSRADEITMREDYGSLSLSLQDDGFGDIGFDGDTPDLMRGALDSNLNDQLFEDQIISGSAVEDNAKMHSDEISGARLEGNGFDVEFGQPELFEDDLFGESPLEGHSERSKSKKDLLQDDDDDDLDRYNTGAPSPSSCGHSEQNEVDENRTIEACIDGEPIVGNETEQQAPLQNEDESFALAPIDASAYKGITKTKRKRKLIVDEIKNISGEEMKAQLANTSDIVTTLDLAPPTKRLMYWKETGGVEKLFSLPSRQIPARVLFINYSRHLVSHFTPLEDFSYLGPSDLLALDQIHPESPLIQNKRGRKRKIDVLQVAHIAETSLHSLAPPEPIREERMDQDLGTCVSLHLDDKAQETSIPLKHSTVFENSKSPNYFNERSRLDNLNAPINDISMTPRNLQSCLDANDDFNHDDLASTELHHGQYTPHHSGLDGLEGMSNFPGDELPSLLQESERIGTKESREIATDWNDYDFSPSVGITNVDEQMENETTEQFEERVLNKRAAQLFFAVKSHLIKQNCLLVSDLTAKNSKKQAAQMFYSLLVLKKFRALEISQSAPYADIIVSRGPLFDNPKL